MLSLGINETGSKMSGLTESCHLRRREVSNLTVISHHMLRRGIADKIVVLDNGEIAEVGTHEYLVTQNGKFAKLLNLYHNTPRELIVNH